MFFIFYFVTNVLTLHTDSLKPKFADFSNIYMFKFSYMFFHNLLKFSVFYLHLDARLHCFCFFIPSSKLLTSLFCILQMSSLPMLPTLELPERVSLLLMNPLEPSASVYLASISRMLSLTDVLSVNFSSAPQAAYNT